jgi:hypothetical protein
MPVKQAAVAAMKVICPDAASVPAAIHARSSDTSVESAINKKAVIVEWFELTEERTGMAPLVSKTGLSVMY